MSWSYIASVNGSSSAASFAPGAWPTGIQDGDIVVFCAMIAPDSGGESLACATSGWRQQSAYSNPARFMWARYSPALALPTITLSGSPTCTWYMLAFRPTESASIGQHFGVDGSPPASMSYAADSSDQLLIIFGSVLGNPVGGWTHSGGFTQIINVVGASANAPNIFIGWKNIASPTTIATIYARIGGENRYYLLAAGQSAGDAFF